MLFMTALYLFRWSAILFLVVARQPRTRTAAVRHVQIAQLHSFRRVRIRAAVTRWWRVMRLMRCKTHTRLAHVRRNVCLSRIISRVGYNLEVAMNLSIIFIGSLRSRDYISNENFKYEIKSRAYCSTNIVNRQRVAKRRPIEEYRS